MLTATYTLVALSVEQASARVSLLSFQKYVQSNFLNQPSIKAGQLDYVCEMLKRLHGACHWRKVEKYLVPAVCKVTQQAEPLLQELGALNLAASNILDAVQARLHDAGVECESQVTQLCQDIDTFCSALLERLEKEEKQLFPLARTVISGEAWFSIANQILVHDAHKQENRRGSSALPQMAGALLSAPAPSRATHSVLVG